MISRWIKENEFFKTSCNCGVIKKYAKGNVKLLFRRGFLFEGMEVYKSGKKIEFKDFEQVKEWYATNI